MRSQCCHEQTLKISADSDERRPRTVDSWNGALWLVRIIKSILYDSECTSIHLQYWHEQTLKISADSVERRRRTGDGRFQPISGLQRIFGLLRALLRETLRQDPLLSHLFWVLSNTENTMVNEFFKSEHRIYGTWRVEVRDPQKHVFSGLTL